MNYFQAVDDYLMHLEVEKNYSINTLKSYPFDLKLYGEFLKQHYGRSFNLDEFTSSSVRRFVQDQVINHKNKPRTLQRRILCLKSFSQYCLKEIILIKFFCFFYIGSPKMIMKKPKNHLYIKPCFIIFSIQKGILLQLNCSVSKNVPVYYRNAPVI